MLVLWYMSGFLVIVLLVSSSGFSFDTGRQAGLRLYDIWKVSIFGSHVWCEALGMVSYVYGYLHDGYYNIIGGMQLPFLRKIIYLKSASSLAGNVTWCRN